MTSFEPKNCSIPQLQRLLSSSVAPRPIALASTISSGGQPNLSPFSFFNVFSTNPPILIFSPARRVRDNSKKHTLQNVEQVKEVVINVVSYDIIQQMSLSSTEYEKNINEFKKAGLKMLKSDIVKPFRVAESPVQMECKVNDIIPLGTQNGAGNLVICQVLKIHICDRVLDDSNEIDQEKLDLVARGGGSYYIRAREGFLEIPKPLRSKGIGVDMLPGHIQNSSILTGNDLGILGNVEEIPSSKIVAEFWAKSEQKELKNILKTTDDKHLKAKEFIQNKDVFKAWCVLLK
ncbi:MAG: flavin reductase family protein [Flavobacteriaceae bacterium]